MEQTKDKYKESLKKLTEDLEHKNKLVKNFTKIQEKLVGAPVSSKMIDDALKSLDRQKLKFKNDPKDVFLCTMESVKVVIEES
jgi:hypothetical protein